MYLEVSIMRCLVCSKPLSSDLVCPRCGFKLAPGLGDPEVVRRLQEEDAEAHCSDYLRQFDFGINCYFWKDQHGVYALERTSRISFGTGDRLYGSTVWIEQEFSRVTKEAHPLTIEVSVRQGTTERTVACVVPGLSEPLTQQLGLRIDQNNGEPAMVLFLRNAVRENCSEPMPFLPD